MEEQEVSLESVNESIHEHKNKVSWAEKVALTTALLAVFAAMSSLFSTHESDKAILREIQASNQWAYYQAKGIKSMMAQIPADKARYKIQQEEIAKGATKKSEQSEHAMQTHEFFAYAVTLFQVATAIGAIAVLVTKKSFWHTSIALGILGMIFALRALLLLSGH